MKLWKEVGKDIIGIEWISSSKIDRIVDSLGLLIMELEEQLPKEEINHDKTYPDEDYDQTNLITRYKLIKDIITNRYESVECHDELRVLLISITGGYVAKISCDDMNVDCECEQLKETLELILRHLVGTTAPMGIN